MLTQIAKSTTTTGTTVLANKQIVVAGTNNNSIMYEVPSGRKFTGTIVSKGNYEVIINTVYILSSSGAVPPYLPIELVAGTKVSSGVSYSSWALVGVETNA